MGTPSSYDEIMNDELEERLEAREERLEHREERLERREEQRDELLQEVLKPEVVREVRAVVRELRVLKREKFSGPLPKPEHFGQYERVLPGTAERILKMAEKEQDHRHAMDREEASQFRYALTEDIRSIHLGQRFTFVLIAVMVISAIVFTALGMGYAALCTIIVAGITGLAAGVMGRRQDPSTPLSKPSKDELDETGDEKKALPEDTGEQ